MQGYCDSCDERAEHLFDITRLPEFSDVVRTFNYRQVCQICYDDLLEESQKPIYTVDDEERRVDDRHELRLEVQIEGTNREGQHFVERTVTEDVSKKGTRIVTYQDIEAGSVLHLKVTGSNFEGTAIVELVWKQPALRKAGLKIIEDNLDWEKFLQTRLKKRL